MKKLAILLAAIMAFAVVPSFAQSGNFAGPCPDGGVAPSGMDMIRGVQDLYNRVKRALVSEEQPSNAKKASSAKQNKDQKQKSPKKEIAKEKKDGKKTNENKK